VFSIAMTAWRLTIGSAVIYARLEVTITVTSSAMKANTTMSKSLSAQPWDTRVSALAPAAEVVCPDISGMGPVPRKGPPLDNT
jgi:hypothetical protein